MIIINYSSLQCLDYCHFDRFNCNAKIYAVETDFKNSDCFSEEKQIYYIISNNNNSENSNNEENNLIINFTLSESSQCKHKY